MKVTNQNQYTRSSVVTENNPSNGIRKYIRSVRHIPGSFWEIIGFVSWPRLEGDGIFHICACWLSPFIFISSIVFYNQVRMLLPGPTKNDLPVISRHCLRTCSSVGRKMNDDLGLRKNGKYGWRRDIPDVLVAKLVYRMQVFFLEH